MLNEIVSVVLAFLVFSAGCADNQMSHRRDTEPINWNNEVIYHVMPRSFHDSNGDGHGDLQGVIQKLDYLQQLGVTAILFTPLVESGFYHNYFPTDYYEIDPEYGTRQDYFNFIVEVHERGMKFIMDMETQYVQNGHIWFDSTYSNPGTAFDDFVYYSDPFNTLPAQLFFDIGTPLYDYKAWPDTTFNIATLDLNSPVMRQWQKEFYAYWVDPNDDGDFIDGVDGFRIDHIMDDLDNKGVFTHLYRDFWAPIFDSCKSINPNLFIVCEQANWGEYGDAIVKSTNADAAFNFQLKFALRNTSDGHSMASDISDTTAWSPAPQNIHSAVDSCLRKFGTGHYFVNFIENHDTDRFASLAGSDDRILKLAATLLATLPGTPSIYYGQELGLTGTIGSWDSDANHIPVREAFPWIPDAGAPGIAAFYKDTGPWWDNSIYNSPTLASLAYATQDKDPNSLLNHYRTVLAMRGQNDPLRLGDYQPVIVEHDAILSFQREHEGVKVLVVTNLSADTHTLSIPELSGQGRDVILSSGIQLNDTEVTMEPYAFMVIKS